MRILGIIIGYNVLVLFKSTWQTTYGETEKVSWNHIIEYKTSELRMKLNLFTN